ncbi:MAG: hypothetical protein ACM3JC_08355 [Rudaea sp.]
MSTRLRSTRRTGGQRHPCQRNHDGNAYEYGIERVGTPANASLHS